MTKLKKFDHIIIGGGIIGASIAWQLTRRSNDSVLLLERNEIGSAASSLAAGLLLQVTSKAKNTALTRLTRETISLLEQELGTSMEFHEVGSIRIAETEKSEGILEALLGDAERNDISAERVNADTAEAMIPWLNASTAREMVYFPTDGYVDPYLFTMAYANAARQRGATIRPRTAVEKILQDNGRAIGVSAANETIYGANVIDAAGAWSAVLSAQAGYALPLAPVRSHYWIAEPDPAFGSGMAGEKAGQHPITILLDAATYTRPELGGLVIGVQESRSATFDARELPDDPATFSIAMGEDHWDALIDASTSIESLCPAIHEARFSSYLAGLSTYTPDGQLVLGEVPGIRGLYAASGCCGSGVMLSAGIGEAAASLLLGQDPPFDLSPYRPDRFGKIDPFGEEFRQLCAQSRSNKIQPQVS